MMFARDIRYPSKIIVSTADTKFNIINKFKLRHFTVTIKYVEHFEKGTNIIIIILRGQDIRYFLNKNKMVFFQLIP